MLERHVKKYLKCKAMLNQNSIKNEKRWWSKQVRLPRWFFGGWLQQLVILPLLGGRGNRCSVKPASRSALLFKRDETYAFAQVPSPNSQLGMGKPAFSIHNSHQGATKLFHHLHAPTWVTSSCHLARREHKLDIHYIKFIFFHIMHNVGLLLYIT